MSKDLHTTPLLELSDFEPETNQVTNRDSDPITGGRTTWNAHSNPWKFAAIWKLFIGVVVVVIPISILVLNMERVTTDPDDKMKRASSAQLVSNKESSKTDLNRLTEQHLSEKRDLIAKQTSIVMQLKLQAEKALTVERAEMIAEQEKQAKQIKNEMEARFLAEREALIAEQEEHAKQLRIEMQSKLHAQRASLLTNQTNLSEPGLSEREIEAKNKITKVESETSQKNETLTTEQNLAEEKQPKATDEEFKATATATEEKQNRIEEKEERLIRARLEKQRIVFLAELKKLAQKQDSEMDAIGIPAAGNSKMPQNTVSKSVIPFPVGADNKISKLFARVQSGNITYLQKYLKKGGNPDSLNKFGEPLITKTASHDQFIMVTELLRAGANVDLPDVHGENALRYASLYGHTGIVKLLIAEGANIDYTNSDSETALMAASQNGFREIVQILIEAGADLNILNSNGRSALHYALETTNNVVVTLLLDSGANNNLTGSVSTSLETLATEKDIALN